MIITVLTLLFFIAPTKADFCPYMCQCTGVHCIKCFRDFVEDSPYTWYPDDDCDCPAGTYLSENERFCQFCPIECISCEKEQQCKICEKGYILHDGKCIRQTESTDRIQFSRDFNPEKYEERNREGFWIQGAVNTSDQNNYFNNFPCQDFGQNVFGHYYFGHNTYLVRTYHGLPEHQFIQLKIQFVVIDQWINQSMIIQVENTPNPDIHNISSSYTTRFKYDEQQRKGYNFCDMDNNYGDNLGIFNKSYPHTSSILKFRIRPQISFMASEDLTPQQQRIYFGITEVLLIVGKCPKGCKICDGMFCADDCKPNYVYNYLTYVCECDVNAAILTKDGDCIPKCEANEAYLENQQKCVTCLQFISGCETCSSDACTQCLTGFFLYDDKCVKYCPPGFQQILDAVYKCIQCPEHCDRCQKGICQSCEQAYFLYQGGCIQECEEGTYLDAYQGICRSCHQNCLSCSSFGECIQCRTDLANVDYALINGECFETCTVTSQVFLYNYDCVAICPSNCLQCFGLNNNQCYICQYPFVRQDYQCLNTCSTGYYALSSICYPCSDRCQECTRLTCSVCSSGYWLYQEQCIMECPVGYYEKIEDKSCQKCGEGCSICYDGDVCQYCQSGLKLIDGLCQTRVDCLVGEYYNVQLDFCMECPEFCNTCYMDLCYECEAGKYLDNGKCVENCPDQKYPNLQKSICIWQDPLCEQYDSVNSICNKCIYLSPPLILSADSQNCLFSCPDGYSKSYTADNSEVSCTIQCPASCLECDASQCYKCESGNLLVPESASPCQPFCPEGYRSDSIQCVKCPVGCKICQQNGQCIECFNPFNSHVTQINELGQCVEQGCLYSFKDVAGSGTCVTCSADCLTCTSDPTQCTSCHFGEFLYQNQCYSFCPLKFYQDIIDGTCLPCYPTCSACQSFHQCSSCESGYNLFEGRCISECPHGYFLYSRIDNYYDSGQGECRRCSPNCQTCYGQSEYQCLTCFEGYALDDSRCVSYCPPGKYEDIFGHCDACSYLCDNCYGPASFQCIDCNDESHSYEGICYDSCPYHTFYDQHEKECEICSSGCRECSSEGECEICDDGYFMLHEQCEPLCPYSTYSDEGHCNECEEDYDHCEYCTTSGCTKCLYPYFRHDKSCTQVCPLGTYEAYHILRQCLNCPRRCIECTSPTSCKRCKANHKLSNEICLGRCRKGYYYNITLQECLSCSHSSCQICGLQNQCSKCYEGKYLYENSCVSTCPDKFFASTSTLSCLPCHSACKKCLYNQTNCLSCETGYILKNNLCVLPEEPQSCGTGCAICADLSKCAVCMAPYYLSHEFSCVEECDDGYFEYLRQCKPCSAKCSSCKSNQQCLQCLPGYSLYGSLCLEECPSGFYEHIMDNNEGTICEPCRSGCSICNNRQQCLYCDTGFILFEDQCLVSCPMTYYYSAGQCIECSDNCLKCYGPYECVQCETDKLLFNGTCVENPTYSCPFGSYLSNINECLKCQSPCLQCSNADSCITCISGYSLFEDSCSLVCPKAYFSKNVTGVLKCQPCSSSCSTCMTNSTICTSCKQNYFLSGQKCVMKCPVSTYGDTVTRICRKCSSFCLYCESNSQCSYCHPSMYLLDGYCVSQCPFGYSYSILELQINAQNKIGAACVKCSSPCLTCQHESIYNCTSCLNGYYLMDTRCLLKCPAGYFPDTIDNLCRKCHPDCLSCSNFDKCTSCKFGTDANTGICLPENPCPASGCPTCGDQCEFCYMQICYKCFGEMHLENGECVSECSPGSYLNEANNSCVEYPPEYHCLSGSSMAECEQCQSNYYLYFDVCYQQCPELTQPTDSTPLSCEIDTCLSQINGQCSSCMSPYFIYDGQCTNKCPSSFYQTASTCEPCPLSCQTCTSMINCTSCKSGFIYYKGQCLNNCPVGLYSSASTCFSCPTVCLSCVSANNCTMCATGNFLSDGYCVSECPIGTTRDFNQKLCKKCSENCLQCLNTTFCQICETGSYFLNGQCLDSCLIGFYSQNIVTQIGSQSVTIGICTPCATTCSNCTATTCLNCNSAYFLYRGFCVSVCRIGTFEFIDGLIKQCKSCTSPCYDCEQTSTNCVSCVAGYYLLDNKCYQSCPSGYYAYLSKCLPCDTSCTTCSSQTVCTSCLSGFDLLNGSCISKCPLINQYYDALNFICRSCSSECLECYGPRYDQCLSCKYPLILVNSVCVSNCQIGTFFDQDLQKCVTCGEACLQCSQITEIECTLCMDNYYLYEGSCVKQCPETYYQNIDTKKCALCSTRLSGCLDCSTNSITAIPTCISCETNKIFNANGQCINTGDCPSQIMVIINDVCQFCEQSCEKCVVNGNGEQECIECVSGFVIGEQKECVSSCENSQTAVLEDNINGDPVWVCYSCIQNCAECTEVGPNTDPQCQQCAIPYYLYIDYTCVISCPTGYIGVDIPIRHCTTATDYEDTAIQSCADNNYLTIADTLQCVPVCPDGYFYQLNADNQQICLKCKAGCLTCLNSNSCLTCATGFYLLNGNQCVSSCPTTHLVVNKKCVACTSPCASCSGTLLTCTTCISGKILFGTSCVDACPDGYYSDGLKCLQCETKCLTCDSDGCLSCSNPYYIAPYCVDVYSNCNSDEYQKSSTSSDCNICHQSCGSCFGPTEFDCLTCADTLVFIDSQCRFACPTGYLKTMYTTPSICIDCSVEIPHCETCQQIDVGLYTCNQCQNPYFLYQQNCIQNCNQLNTPTEIYSLSNGSCILCIADCAVCFEGQCLECSGSKLLQTLVNGTKRCVDACSTGFYEDIYVSSNPECLPCDATCESCTDSTECTTCPADEYFFGDSCVSACPNATVLDYTSTYCLPCNEQLSNKCLSCTNSGVSSDILSCIDCIFPYLPDNQGLCRRCENGYYLSTSSFTCLSCNSTCTQCTSLYSCTACISGLVLVNSKCALFCHPNQYISGNACVSCTDANCLKCTSSECLQCNNGYGLYQGACEVNCPATTILINKVCELCESGCSLCTTLTSCTQCLNTHILFDESCFSTCPSGYTSDGNGECIKCKSGCLQCEDTANTCTLCQDGLTNNNDGTCTYQDSGVCQSGEYEANGVCLSCDSSCLECLSSGPNKCLECPPGFYLTITGYCISSCSNHQYYSTGTSSCQQCSPICAQCINSATECRSCPTGKLLTISKTCEDVCPQGTYISNMICTDCPDLCLTCVSSTKCLTCQNGVTFFYNSLCYTECPMSSFANTASTCEACPTGCLTCISSTNCESCEHPYIYYLNPNTDEGQCLQNCPDQTYGKDNVCIACPIQNCLGCNETTCFECVTDTYLFENQCLDDCLQTYYIDSNNICEKCVSPCYNCSSPYKCLSCQLDYLLLQITSEQVTCVDQCPQGYQDIDGECIAAECENCSICIDAKCELCYEGFFMYEGLCYNSCVQRYYENETAQICSPCIQNCLDCPNDTYCYTCIPNFNFTQQTGCADAAFIEFGVLANMSGFTSNITEITSMVYLSTSAGPLVFGQMANTYFNIELCQFFFFHEGATQENEELATFLESLSYMSMSSGISSFSNRRMLMATNSLNFLQVNVPIFILIGSFLAVYLLIFIVLKNIDGCCLSCPNLHFYAKEIFYYMKKRFKWIYFDFIMWLSFLPFLYFGLMQIQKFNFDSALEGISSILSILFILVYPLYPFFICYQIKKHYEDICKETNDIIEMSLSPWLSKVKRPEEIAVGEQFKYFTKANFRLIYYPLKYFRKFIFVLVVATCPVPVATLGILIGLNVLFIIYMGALRPRKMPYMAFDFIIEGVLLGFQIFLLVYLTYGIADVNAMSIIAHSVGFITANLSIIIAIILNIVAYYHIFLCLYGLVKHLRVKMEEKQKNQMGEEKSSKMQDPDDEIKLEKEIIQVDFMTEALSEDEREIAKDLDDKDLVINNIQPRYNITTEEHNNLFGDKEMSEHARQRNNDNMTEVDIKTEQLSDEERNIAHFLDDKDLIINGIQPKYHNIAYDNERDLMGDKQFDDYYRNNEGNIFNDKDLQLENNPNTYFDDDNIRFTNNRNNDIFLQDKQLFDNQNNKVYKVYDSDDDNELPSMKQKKKKNKNKNKKTDSRKKLMENHSQASQDFLYDNSDEKGHKLKMKFEESPEEKQIGLLKSRNRQVKKEISRERNQFEEDEIYYVDKSRQTKGPIKKQQAYHPDTREINVKSKQTKIKQSTNEKEQINSESDSQINLLSNRDGDFELKSGQFISKRDKNRKQLDNFDTFLENDEEPQELNKNDSKNRLQNMNIKKNAYYKGQDDVGTVNTYGRKRENSKKDLMGKDPQQVGFYERKNNKVMQQQGQNEPKEGVFRLKERSKNQKTKILPSDFFIQEGQSQQRKPKQQNRERNREQSVSEVNNAIFKNREAKNGQEKEQQEASYYLRSSKRKGNSHNKKGSQLDQARFFQKTRNKNEKEDERNLQEGNYREVRPKRGKKVNTFMGSQEENQIQSGQFKDRNKLPNKKSRDNQNDGEEVDQGLLVTRKPTKTSQKQIKYPIKQKQKELQEARLKERERAAKEAQQLRFTRGRADNIGQVDEGLMMSVNPKTRNDFRKKNLPHQQAIYEQAEEPEQLREKQKKEEKKEEQGFFSKLFGFNGKKENEEKEQVQVLGKKTGHDDVYFEENNFGSRNSKVKGEMKSARDGMKIKKSQNIDEDYDEINRPSKINSQRGQINKNARLNLDEESDPEEFQEYSSRKQATIEEERPVDSGLQINHDDSFENQASPKRMRRSRVGSKKDKKGKLNLNEKSMTFEEEDEISRKQRVKNMDSARRPKNSSLHIQKRQKINEQDIESIQL